MIKMTIIIITIIIAIMIEVIIVLMIIIILMILIILILIEIIYLEDDMENLFQKVSIIVVNNCRYFNKRKIWLGFHFL